VSKDHRLSRRSALRTVGAAGAAAFLGNCTSSDAVAKASEPPKQSTDLRKHIFSKIWTTPLIDTHEHLCDEHTKRIQRTKNEKDRHFFAIWSVGSYDNHRDAFPKWEG
jgi:hypothetical protein